MGYRGKVELRLRARELRSEGWTMPDIATLLGVSRSSVSLWTRDVIVELGPRRRAHAAAEPPAGRPPGRDRGHGPSWHRARSARSAEQAFLAAGAALYAGEGAKRDGMGRVRQHRPGDGRASSSPGSGASSTIDESRLRVRLYLHEGLDLDEATRHVVGGDRRSAWAVPYAIPRAATRRASHDEARARHARPCSYSCSRTHRAVMGLVRALLSSTSRFRGSSIGRAPAC